jgi:hypothetical protein
VFDASADYALYRFGGFDPVAQRFDFDPEL